jgi:hypothetical protein
VTRSILIVHRDKKYSWVIIVEYLKAKNGGGKREVWDLYHSTVNTQALVPKPAGRQDGGSFADGAKDLRG